MFKAMDPYKMTASKGRGQGQSESAPLSLSMSSAGVCRRDVFQHLIRKTEAPLCIPGLKDLNIGNAGLNYGWDG